ncbi:GGDEF domain-containing protein [Arcobacter sp. CECT 8983]|uniref:GGDEF domain-containing protein n=1 Tax=Arcobacter sp. CECT 8983 TaxID=2044508 RepID=UPI00100ACD2F|nr:GGDEF domain-containing protein [Arcobacter sp. CECT 8983]RXJ89190.1 GGDEF domain-containing protein [Arcobacter sp. CECT 8983]
MDSTKKITKLTLESLKDKDLESTPINYEKEFLEQAKTIDKELYEELLQKNILSELNYFIECLPEIISPSINFNNDEKINSFLEKVNKNPKKLLNKTSIEELKEITKERVKADREVLKNKTDDIIKLSNLMEKYFDKTILESTNSSEKFDVIKNELKDLNISNASYRELGQLQSKLINTIYSIEHSMQNNRVELNESKEQFDSLNKKIEELQKELAVVKQEKSTDFLTSVLNRRAYEEEVEKIEKKHEAFESNYAIVFYDIDHFKQINDTYGHTCGDTVLKTFGKILKSLTRKEDVIARYGGEEFLALINYEEEKELYKYIKRVKNLITTTKFKYKDIRIHVEFSAGVSFRANYTNYIDAKKKSDDLLYQAKKEGRNKVIFDNGVIL